MGEQMTILQYLEKVNAKELHECMNPPEPLCYSCEHGIRRGAFRLCRKGGKGYKRLGQYCECKLYRLQDSN